MKKSTDQQVNCHAANNNYFDRQEIWEDLSDGEKQRIQDTISLIPGGITTILNVGCGDGRVTKSLSHKYKVVGVDVSTTAATLFHGQAVIGSINALPFKDCSFDMVMTTEVLEHLPEQIFEVALRELQRVAKSSILVTVPNDEVLEANFMQCIECKTVYHAWNHLRTFSKKFLESMLPEFSPQKIVALGINQPVLYCWFYQVLQRFGDTWSFSERAICPSCGSVAQPRVDGNLFGSLWKRLIWRIYDHTPFKKRTFLGAIYRRIPG